MTDTAPDTEQQERVVELMRDAGVTMLVHTDAEGHLVAHPMANQEVDDDGTIRFIAERNSTKVQDLETNPNVNVSYSGRGAWLSVSGTARVVNDEAKLRELWSTMTDSWLSGGPDDPDNVLLEVTPDTAEYWAAPGGSTVISLANLVKSRLTGRRIEGENETVDL